jgi:hypothetical protein
MKEISGTFSVSAPPAGSRAPEWELPAARENYVLCKKYKI